MKKILIVFLLISLITGCQKEKLDLLIQGGMVYDGSLSEPTQMDIGIKDDRIVFVGANSKYDAHKIIDATGLAVMPGFIDPHTHSLADLRSEDVRSRSNLNYLKQGVTTVFNGNDGDGEYMLEELFTSLESKGIGTNVAMFVGHNTVRSEVMGRENRPPTTNELDQMKKLVAQGMDEGGFGFSTGLFYVPGTYATTDEVIELSKVAAKKGGLYESHIRDESTYTVGLKAAVEEVIEIGTKAQIPVHIAHIKALGVDVWGMSDTIINMVEKAQAAGLTVTADQYPWQASGIRLHKATVPSWVLAGDEKEIQARFQDLSLLPRIRAEIKENIRRRGGADALLVVTSPEESLVNKTLKQISEEWKVSAVDAVIRIAQIGITENSSRVASFNMNAKDIQNFMTQPWVMTSSDGTNGHPRKYASYPQKYQKYVVQNGLMSISTYVYKCSGQVADTFGVYKRGYIRKGNYADISVISLEDFKAMANFSKWNNLTTGVRYQWVNGTMTIEEGEYTDALPGKGLRKK